MNNRILGVFTATCVACGSLSCGGAEGSGGSGGSGGATGSSFAGNGGALPLPNQGSITLRVALPTSPASGETCPDSGTTYAAGLPAPSMTSPGGSLVDGEHGAQVSCAVQGTGPFTFSGSLKATTTTGEPFPIQVVLTDGSVGADFTGTANVSIYTPKLTGNFSGTSCIVQVVGQQIKGGAIWASFSCPSVFEPPAQQCTASGIFVFENCLGS